MKKALIIIASIILFFALANYLKLYVQTSSPYAGLGRFEKNYVPIPEKKAPSDYITYTGEDGVSAYQILVEKEHAWLLTNSSGLIISINDRKADLDKHEFWAFYVNGKMAEVGPQDYITKGVDKIEWKIETY